MNVIQELSVSGRDGAGVVQNLAAVSPSIAAHVELAYQPTDGGCLLWGWLFDPDAVVDAFVLILGNQVEPIRANGKGRDASALERVERRDVSAQFAHRAPCDSHMHGFLIYARVPASELRLGVRVGGLIGEIPFAYVRGLDRVERVLHNVSTHHSRALSTFCRRYGLADSALRDHFRPASLPRFLDIVGVGKIQIDVAFPLKDAGLLIFGWRVLTGDTAATFSVVGPEGQQCTVTNRFLPLARSDVRAAHQQTHPELTEWCGFLIVAPIPTCWGERRALWVRGQNDEGLLEIPTADQESEGLSLAKRVLQTIPQPDALRSVLHDMFDSGFGSAIESIHGNAERPSVHVESRAFGRPPMQPRLSVVVPLYGRHDWIRHQMAQFAQDPEFRNIDLVYVVDDPAIQHGTLDLAAVCHNTFGVSFRVLWYNRNLGYAGANNVAADFARGDALLLMNSDVLPTSPGWSGKLLCALDELPQAGAVAPLLLFADKTVQHAGMVPQRSPMFPGFLLNDHPGRGLIWRGQSAPSEHPLLTAACLMLRKADFQEVGGFDDGYLVGDFEDSDLCLSLRKRGKRMWLVPEVTLWHLERQSQNPPHVAAFRQLLTLFNSWRYERKILDGLLPDPESCPDESRAS